MRMHYIVALAALAGVGGTIAACTHNTVVLKQPKPMVVDVNLNGKLTLVVKDARNDMAYIAGKKAPQKVIIQPVAPGASGGGATTDGGATPPGSASGGSSMLYRPWMRDRAGDVMTLDVSTTPLIVVVSKPAILKKLKAEFSQVQLLLDQHFVGESHTGLLAVRGQLSGSQRQLMQRENTLRSQLYAKIGKQKGESPAKVGLAFFVARLPYIKHGDWVQKYSNARKKWVWIRWEG